MVIKIPDYTNKEILEILKRVQLDVKYAAIKRKYGITYYDIKRICSMFSGCIFEDDCQEIKDKIEEQNRIDLIRDHRANYIKYKDYYTRYNRDRQAERIAARQVAVAGS